MPGILKVRIIAARDLPIMDRATELADAYVQVQFGNTTHKTPVCKKSLDPTWNKDFRFDVSDGDLQDFTLNISVWDQDVVSADDIIGVVHVDINPLLLQGGAQQIAGWLPIFDTLRGVRGELHVVVKAQVFSDANRFRESSVGVHFFANKSFPAGFFVEPLKTPSGLAFVEEVLVQQDPDFHFLDSFRTMRSSNDARHQRIAVLAGELKRRMGVKVIELGGNAVVGYSQFLDIEGEYGIVARGIGTACLLVDPSSSTRPTALNMQPTTAVTTPEVDPSADPPASPEVAAVNPDTYSKNVIKRHIQGIQDLPLITVTTFPNRTLRRIGGMVTARSIKLLDNENENELGDRDSWWLEIRDEIRSHARALGCMAVIGYTEKTSVCGDLLMLSASGTAAVLSMTPVTFKRKRAVSSNTDGGLGAETAMIDVASPMVLKHQDPMLRKFSTSYKAKCSVCHIPYLKNKSPWPLKLVRCGVCRKGYVPESLFCSIDVPDNLEVVGSGRFIEARVVRAKKKNAGEMAAINVSEMIPFIEYDLHMQLLKKLKIYAMNSIFGMRSTIAIEETFVVAIIYGTALLLAALPAPSPLKFTHAAGLTSDDSRNKWKSQVERLSEQNREQLKAIPPTRSRQRSVSHNSLPSDDEWSSSSSNSSDSDDELNDVHESRKAFVVEIDDAADEEQVKLLIDPVPPSTVKMCTTEVHPGLPGGKAPVLAQLVTALRRIPIHATGGSTKQISDALNLLHESFWHKLKPLSPVSISNFQYDLQPHDECLDVVVTATVSLVYLDGITSDDRDPFIAHLSSAFLSHERVHASSAARTLGHRRRASHSSLSDDVVDEYDAGVLRDDGAHATTATKIHKVTSNPKFKKRNAVPPLKPASSMPSRFVVLTSCGECSPNPTRSLGHVTQVVIKESTNLRDAGTLSTFIHTAVVEAQAILRAQVAALGANALTSFSLDILTRDRGNAAYVLLVLSGDAVQVLDGDHQQQQQQQLQQHQQQQQPIDAPVSLSDDDDASSV